MRGLVREVVSVCAHSKALPVLERATTLVLSTTMRMAVLVSAVECCTRERSAKSNTDSPVATEKVIASALGNDAHVVDVPLAVAVGTTDVVTSWAAGATWVDRRT